MRETKTWMIQWRSQANISVPLCKFQVSFKLLSLFIALEIDLDTNENGDR